MIKLIDPWKISVAFFTVGFLLGAALPTKTMDEPQRTQVVIGCVLQLNGTITQCECLMGKAPFKSEEDFVASVKACK